jgi:putative SOS response-associated peptidase YedK
MCGRFVSARKRLELLEEFGIARDRVAASPGTEPEPDYNVAPTKRVYAVMTRHDADKGADRGKARKPRDEDKADEGTAREARDDDKAREPRDEDKARELRVVRWGLVPFWAKDASGSGRLINARVETVAAKPAFRRAFAKRRCILPADGYYEWQVVSEEGKQRKQPYFIHRRDGGSLAFAGLYELWRDESLPEDHERAWLWTAAIITTQAADEVGQIHDRMPMVIAPEHWDDWLDPDLTDPNHFRAAMQPAMNGELTSYPVSTAVNAVRNNGPELIRPL